MLGGSPASSGPTTTGASPLEKTPSHDASGGFGGMMKAQGPGLGDLLTEGDSHAVYGLPEAQTSEYTQRLDRIERMLEALVGRPAERVPSTDVETVVGVDTAVSAGSDSASGHNWKKESDRSAV